MLENKLNGLIYKVNKKMYAKGDERYLTLNNRLYYNRAAKFIEERGIHDNIINRLEKYYQNLYIDEIQDFAGHDFELLKTISQSRINILFTGDFFSIHLIQAGMGMLNKAYMTIIINIKEYSKK